MERQNAFAYLRICDSQFIFCAIWAYQDDRAAQVVPCCDDIYRDRRFTGSSNGLRLPLPGKRRLGKSCDRKTEQ